MHDVDLVPRVVGGGGLERAQGHPGERSALGIGFNEENAGREL